MMKLKPYCVDKVTLMWRIHHRPFIVFPFVFLFSSAFLFLGPFLFMGLMGCQSFSLDSVDKPSNKKSQTFILPDRDEASHAQGEAYTADSLLFRKPMPSRPDWKPMEFYSKHCQETGERGFISKTSYECTY